MNRIEHNRMVQTAAKDTVIGLLQDAGYDVQIGRDSAPNDIKINGTLSVEIRGALWTKHANSKGRYQFQTRTNADVYILACLTYAPRFFVVPGNVIGARTLACSTYAPRFFVVPGNVIGARTNVAIWSEFPSKYTGRWSQYCDNWNVIKQELS